MDQVKEESGKRENGQPGRRIPGKIFFRAVMRKIRRGRRGETPDPWTRIRERKGCRTLEWGMGDGKTFGSVPLDPEVAFSVDAEGVKLRSGEGDPVTIGSPGNESANILLSRKIEKVLRNRGSRFLIAGASIGVLFFLVLLAAGPVLGRIASFPLESRLSGDPGLSGSLPGGGGEFPSSMSSGLTCHTH